MQGLCTGIGTRGTLAPELPLAHALTLAAIVVTLTACLPDATEPPDAGTSVAAETTTALPPPRTDAPVPLMKALAKRHSTREYIDTELSEQQLSDLLWAAFGQNRDTGGRTAPSAYGNSEIDVYAALSHGTYRYDAGGHQLVTVAPGDLRELTGTQDFVADAALNLIYVADLSRMDRIAEADKEPTAMMDAGFIGQNVYLFCAAEGLATVFRGSVNRPPLAKALGLDPAQQIMAAQTVGYAAD